MTTITAAATNVASATVAIALELDWLIHLRADLSSQSALYSDCNSVKEARELLLAGWRPMWPAIPSSEQSTTRGSSPTPYLYLYWPRAHGGEFVGPNGARKTYLGNKPANIALAREMISARRRFLALRAAVRDASSAILRTEHQATRLGHVIAAGRIAAESVLAAEERAHAD